MQANEFEKKVQQTMDEFKLRPSDEVWLVVERKIRDKKRKRRIFLVLFLFIGLALAGYGIYDYSAKQIATQNEDNVPEKINNKRNSTIEKSSVPQPGTTATKKLSDKRKNYKQNPDRKSTAVAKKNILAIHKRSFIAKDEDGHVKINSDWQKDPGVEKMKVPRAETISIAPVPLTSRNEQGQKIQTGSLKREFVERNVVDSTLLEQLRSNSTAQKIKTGKATTKNHSHKMQWGINFSTGWSVITEDPFSFKSSNSQADALSASPTSYPAGAPTRYPPSANKPAIAFKTGIFASRKISFRSRLLLGLQYSYLGDRIKAATTQTPVAGQSALFSYYAAAPQKTHFDRFHFIELPLDYSWQIHKGNSHYVSLNGGPSIGYLLGTNALTYDTSFGGVYFHDKSLFTKAHLNMTMGMSYHFTASKNFEWRIGPQFSFDLTRVIKTDLDRRKYFLYGGIDARMFFQKKK